MPVMPEGCMDVHVHGIGGAGTREGSIEAMALELGRAGVSAFLPTVYPASIGRMRADVEAIGRAMRGPAREGAARVLGANLEGPYLNPQWSGALDKAALRPADADDFRGLVEGLEDLVRVVTVAPELPGALGLIRIASDMGIRVSMGHSGASYDEARRGREAGASCVTHLFNAMRPMHHREPGLAGYALMDEDLYVELIADGVHVRPEVMRMVVRLKGPGRVILVSDGVTGEGRIGGVLQGGKVALPRCVEGLAQGGFDEGFLRAAVWDNPLAYLGPPGYPG